jgi:hypothetical protein
LADDCTVEVIDCFVCVVVVDCFPATLFCIVVDGYSEQSQNGVVTDKIKKSRFDVQF